MLRAVIIGATGRMGRALARAAGSVSGVRISGAIASAGSAHLGRDLGELAGIDPLGVPVSADLPAALGAGDVAIDFSVPAATAQSVRCCEAAGTPLLVGTTGLTAEQRRDIERAAQRIAVLVAPNTSIGVTVLIDLVRRAAKALPAEFDIEIVEAHHRAKRDAPSGTALALGRAAAEGRGDDPEKALKLRRESGTARATGEIGFAVVRGGDLVGEHTVLFAGPGEQLTLGHRATDRAVFAVGALRAALWLAGKPPGCYTMADVISGKSNT